MKLSRLSLVSSLFVVLAATGCASDPNKKVESSETNLTSEQQKARNDQAELDKKQADERAQKQNQGWEKNAEMQQKHESEQAAQNADARKDISGANKDVQNAHANMAQERRDFDAKVQERLDKADAKAKELKTKSAKLDAKKSSEFNTNYKLYTQARTDADARYKTIKTTADDNWASTKSDLEKRLDTMESALDKAGNSF